MPQQPKTWRTWTTLELRRLEDLRHRGLTVAQIAADLGRTAASVKCRLTEESILAPGRGNAGRWLALLSRPHTIRGVAAATGLSVWAVKRAKNRLRRRGYRLLAATRGG